MNTRTGKRQGSLKSTLNKAKGQFVDRDKSKNNPYKLRTFLSMMNAVAFAVHTGMAVTFGTLTMDDDFTVDTYLHYTTWNKHNETGDCSESYMEGSNCFITPAAQFAGHIDLSNLLWVNHTVSATFHLLVLIMHLSTNHYMYWLQTQIQPLRWAEYFITSSIMTLLISVLIGVNDIMILTLLFTTNAFTMGFGMVYDYYMMFVKLAQENQNYQLSMFERWIVQWFGWFLFMVQWAVMYVIFVVSARGAEVPDFVYWIVGLIFTLYNMFGFVQVQAQFDFRGTWLNFLTCLKTTYTMSEILYILLSITAKSTLTLIMYFSLLNRPE